MDREDYVEAVLATVERVPWGRVTTYGAVAEFIGSGGPRQVGAVMARYGGPVPWWRVVRADGSLPPSHQGEGAAGLPGGGHADAPLGRRRHRRGVLAAGVRRVGAGRVS